MRSVKFITLIVTIATITILLSSCAVNKQSAPYKPVVTNPKNGSTILATSVILSWNCSDPNNSPLTYTLYFDHNAATPTTIIASSISRNFYQVSVNYNTSYSWRVIAKNEKGKTTIGDVWTFKVGNALPVKPYDEKPTSGQTNVSTSTKLSWNSYDPDGDTVTYSVYFGTSTVPPFVGKTPFKTYNPGPLNASTTYYWQIVAEDVKGGKATGTLWHFKTIAKPNRPPLPASNPSPSNGQKNVQPINVKLSWQDSDPDGDPLTYYVYFGKKLTFIGTTTSLTYSLGTIDYGATYTWMIVSKDPHGGVATSNVWSFSTIDRAPNKPILKSPSNGATNVAVNGVVFSWSGSDPDGNPLTYNLYFGTSTNPPLQKRNIMTTSYKANLKKYNTKYYWKVVAIDSFGKESPSDTWSFKTSNPPNRPPLTPSNPNPANEAIGVSVSPTLSWQDSDPDGDPLTYDLYFGTSSNPPLKHSGLTDRSFKISGLTNSTKYYWKVVAKDNHGNVTTGPVWSFTTISLPPNAASSPYPANGQTAVSPDTQLSWYSGNSNVTYTVYIGTSKNSMKPVAYNLNSSLFTPVLNYFQASTTYYWKVVTKRYDGSSSTSPIWSFTTGANAPDGRVVLDDVIVGAKAPFILGVRGIALSGVKGIHIILKFDPSKVVIDTSKGNNGVSLAGPLSTGEDNVFLPSPTVDNSNGTIDISLAILSGTVNIPNNVCLKVYFKNKMIEGVTTISISTLDVRNASNKTMDVSKSDLGVIRVQ